MSTRIEFRMQDDVADWLKSEAKKQGKTQTELVEQALNNMRFGERQGADKITQIWNDNGRIIGMLESILTGDMSQQIAFIHSKVAAKNGSSNASKFDQTMLPQNADEVELVTGSQKPDLMMHFDFLQRAKLISNYWAEWRNAGNAMPQMPQF